MASSGKRGFLRNAFDAMIAARQREANRYVNGVLLMLDDEALKARGYDRAELNRSSKAGYYF